MSYADQNLIKGYQKFLKKLAEETGLSYYEKAMTLYGRYNGHIFSVKRMDGNYTCVQASVRVFGQVPNKEFVQSLARSSKSISKAYFDNNKICFQIAGLTEKKIFANVIATLDLISAELTRSGAVDVCEHCGSTTEDIHPYGFDTEIHHYCCSCAAGAERIEVEKIIEAESVEENVPAGVVGALLGALGGAAVILLISQLGYYAAIGGIAMAFLSFFGYEKLGKKLSTKGIIITTVIMILMVFAACYVDFALMIQKELLAEGVADVSFGLILVNLIPFLQEVGAMTQFLGNLGLMYLFTALGAVPMIKRKLSERKHIDDVVNKSGRAA